MSQALTPTCLRLWQVQIDAGVLFDQWGPVLVDHLQFVCQQNMLGIIPADVLPRKFWSVFDDGIDLQKLVEELVLGEVEGMLTRGVVLVCGASVVIHPLVMKGGLELLSPISVLGTSSPGCVD